MFKKEMIKFEKDQLDSFEITFPKDIKNSDPNAYETRLIVILSNII
ncbi:MAG: hypothetical protein JXA99_08495 [Candidatus Lokiarchaeota archaeon]|nr:hypothetical protein [Candidatus Lokiarchaeota archaeon]